MMNLTWRQTNAWAAGGTRKKRKGQAKPKAPERVRWFVTTASEKDARGARTLERIDGPFISREAAEVAAKRHSRDGVARTGVVSLPWSREESLPFVPVYAHPPMPEAPSPWPLPLGTSSTPEELVRMRDALDAAIEAAYAAKRQGVVSRDGKRQKAPSREGGAFKRRI